MASEIVEGVVMVGIVVGVFVGNGGEDEAAWVWPCWWAEARSISCDEVIERLERAGLEGVSSVVVPKLLPLRPRIGSISTHYYEPHHCP